MSFNETEPVVGETVSISALVANDGNAAGRFRTGLTVDDVMVALNGVRIGAGESDRIEFDWTFRETGSHEIEIGSIVVGEIHVREERVTSTANEGPPATETSDALVTEEEGRLRVLAASSVYSWVRAGFNGSVSVTVLNPADRAVTQELTITVGGEPVASRAVTVGSGERKQVTLDFPATNGLVEVEGVEAGALRVSEAEASNASAADGPPPDSGLFPTILVGLGTIVLVLVGAFVIVSVFRGDDSGSWFAERYRR